MLPILFNAFGTPVPAYGFFLAAAYVTGLLVVRAAARRRGLPEGALTDLCFLGLCAGLVGGRILFVVTNWSYYRAQPLLAFDFRNGGLVFYGSFLLALPLAAIYLRARRLPLAASFDVLAPGLAFGHAVGRLGCFFAGCCHGRYCPWPWGVRFDSDQVESGLRGLPLHPTQLYECAGLLVLGVLLWRLLRKPETKAGVVAATYVTGYALLRFVVELFRGDSIRGFVPGTPFATSQAIALACLLAGGLLLARVRRH